MARTRTMVIFGVSAGAYEEIATKLRKFGYDAWIRHDGTIDMDGIGLQVERTPTEEKED